MKGFLDIWRGSPKHRRSNKDKDELPMEVSNKLSMGDLKMWAGEDSPGALKAYVFKVPLWSPPQLNFSPATPEEVTSLIQEVVPNLLTHSPEGWQLVSDKHGKLPFNHRYLFGRAEDVASGLWDCSSLVPPPVEGQPNPKATLAISSHLGTGKTTLFKFIAEQYNKGFLFPKVLYISARRSFTQSQMGEMKDIVRSQTTFTDITTGKKVTKKSMMSMGFKSYLDLGSKLAYTTRLFCQTESLHKFIVDGQLPDRELNQYNVVILDEWESIVASLRPSTTMKGNLLKNLAVLQELVRTADIVVAGDAFLTTRSLDVLKELRSDQAHPLRLLINHANPYGTGCLGAQERTMSRCRVMSEKPKGKLSKAKLAEWSPSESIVGSISIFHSKLVADLKAGLKVVAVWGSRKAGQAFEAYLKEHFISASERITYATVIQRWYKWVKGCPLQVKAPFKPSTMKLSLLLDPNKPPTVRVIKVATFFPRIFLADQPPPVLKSLLPNRFRYEYFHAGNKATSFELTDLNTKWASLNYLSYSPTITVGVNYNPLDTAGKPTHCFNRLYIYACRYGATPRDLFQASLRVRVIQPPAGTPHLNYPKIG